MGLISTITKAFRIDPNRGTPQPRKGQYHFANTVVSKKQQRTFALNSATLKRLADTDPITWAIRRVIKGYISQTPWDIVADTQCIETELDRWEESILNSINPYGFGEVHFKSSVLGKEIQAEIQAKVLCCFLLTTVLAK